MVNWLLIFNNLSNPWLILKYQILAETAINPGIGPLLIFFIIIYFQVAKEIGIKDLIAAKAEEINGLQSSNYYITCILKNNSSLEDIHNG